MLVQVQELPALLQRADAVATVTVEPDLARRARDQHFAGDQVRRQPLASGARGVAVEQRHLDPVHGEDHRAGRAVLAERGDGPRELGDRATGAAVLDGHERAEQPGGAHSRHRLVRIAALGVGLAGLGRSDGPADLSGDGREVSRGIRKRERLGHVCCPQGRRLS